jgi:hypothetical protein
MFTRGDATAPGIPFQRGDDKRRHKRLRGSYVHEATRLGPYSRQYTGRSWSDFGLVRVDKRTKEAWLIEKVRKALQAEIGPNRTVVQNYLIDRAAILALRLAQIDRRIIEEETLTILDNSQTVAWQNALTRVLVALGANKSNAIHRPSLNEIRAEVGL